MYSVFPVLTLFFGSFLLFGIQPMVGRTLLPSFGGSATVWTICLAAYQMLLLLGYAYTHALAHRNAILQRRIHFALLTGAVIWTFGFAALRLFFRDRFGNFHFSSLEVFFCVLFCVGLPYVLLSANSTLIQAWLVRAQIATTEDTSVPLTKSGTSRKVYKLYAISNLGSLLGLLIYPFLLEPFVSLTVQWYGFGICLLFYTLLLACVARTTEVSVSAASCCNTTSVTSGADAATPDASDSSLPATLCQPWLWLALPALSTFLLNAITTHLCNDVSPMPLMWVALLVAYLFSFILGFSVIGEKGLIVCSFFVPLTLIGAASASSFPDNQVFLFILSFDLGTVLIGCTFLHGWLYCTRPNSKFLTRFYLYIAAGGALGGASASLLAPMLFSRVWEYPLALVALSLFFAWMIRAWNYPGLKGLSLFLLFLSFTSIFIH